MRAMNLNIAAIWFQQKKMCPSTELPTTKTIFFVDGEYEEEEEEK